jgi:23S rRNA (guanosine2251-2'-O)-methyltransferase
MIVIWGRNAVYEALRGRRKVYRIYMAMNLDPSDIIRRIEAEARDKKVTIQKSPRQDIDRLAATTEHQGVVAQVEEYKYSDVEDILKLARDHNEPPFILILDSLQDPQNFGSLLRTAESVGVHGAIIPKRRAVEVTPSVVKASAGAVEHLLVAQVTRSPAGGI